jgi:hypothetical protein
MRILILVLLVGLPLMAEASSDTIRITLSIKDNVDNSLDYNTFHRRILVISDNSDSVTAYYYELDNFKYPFTKGLNHISTHKIPKVQFQQFRKELDQIIEIYNPENTGELNPYSPYGNCFAPPSEVSVLVFYEENQSIKKVYGFDENRSEAEDELLRVRDLFNCVINSEQN